MVVLLTNSAWFTDGWFTDDWKSTDRGTTDAWKSNIRGRIGGLTDAWFTDDWKPVIRGRGPRLGRRVVDYESGDPPTPGILTLDPRHVPQGLQFTEGGSHRITALCALLREPLGAGLPALGPTQHVGQDAARSPRQSIVLKRRVRDDGEAVSGPRPTDDHAMWPFNAEGTGVRSSRSTRPLRDRPSITENICDRVGNDSPRRLAS